MVQMLVFTNIIYSGKISFVDGFKLNWKLALRFTEGAPGVFYPISKDLHKCQFTNMENNE